MSVNIIFRIAAVGILVTILVQVLKHSGRDEQAFLITLAGLILVLGWVIPYIYDLFESVQTLFTISLRLEADTKMIKVAVFGIVASLIAMKIKTIRPEIAVVIAVIASILLAMYGLKQMEEILTVFEMIRSYSKIPQSYFQILLKLIGISFICEFASNICKDAGQASIAKQIEFAGKLAILIVGLPVFESLLGTIQKLLGNGT